MVIVSKWFWSRSLIGAIALLAALPRAGVAEAIATPANVFRPHLDRIRQNLPSQFAMRLPSRILLGDPADDEFINRLIVKVFAFDSPPSLIVGLFSCEDGSPFCQIGTFSVGSASAPTVQRAWQQHIAAAAPIQLTPSIRGYVLDKRTVPIPATASSVMWQQGDMIYTVSFAAPERQNMLYMAVSMANSEPIYALNRALRDLPARTFP